MKKKKNIFEIMSMLFSSILFLILCIYQIQLTNINNINEILSSLINFIAITTGFIMTTLGIIASASNSRIVKKIAKSEKVKQLNFFFIEPLVVGIGIVLLSMLEMSFNQKTNYGINIINSSFIIALTCYFFVLFFRIGYLSMNILEEIMKENMKVDVKKDKAVSADTSRAFNKELI